MKILTASQIKSTDEFTIQHEPIASIDLMERAATVCFRRIIKLIKHDKKVTVFCGQGNNGGDGLAITQLLLQSGYDCEAVVIHHSEKFSNDAQENYNRLKEKFPQNISDIHTIDELKAKNMSSEVLIIDALLGTGINKPVENFLGEVIAFLNAGFKSIVSIDVPSGLFCDKTSLENKNVVQSSLTLTFQFPKLAFLFPENKNFVPEFEILDIGLHPQGILSQQTNLHYLTRTEISSLIKPRSKFSHKGTFGHALLLAGGKGKSGAAIISALGCMRSGAGLLTVHSTKETLNALLHHLPEAMSSEDKNADFISEIEKPENYDAIGFGCGVGLHEDTQNVLKKLLHYYSGKLIIDADGLNILSENKTWLSFLPPNTILTPHPKEFERLAGKSENDFERLEILKQFSIKHNCIVVLKDAHSAIAMPDGNIFFNSSGNAGLAKAGSGDGLTGIILGLLARGYNAPQAALIGVFAHGLAADIFAKRKSKECLLISDVIDLLPKAFKQINSK
ncbi:MAG: NAD(P)H-hydrate dehydratase [Bacteroidetes bacterium]|nr:NAD(P)H-hydrate dehydratase [Bacteroidota bacterium]